MTNLERRQLAEKIAKLQTNIAIKNAQIMANPEPYIIKMQKLCSELFEVLDQVEYALSPDYVFDFWDEQVDKNMIPEPGCLQGEAIIRCNKALEVISTWKNKK